MRFTEVSPRHGAPARVCVCVDDFGLHPAINQAVLHLVELGRVQATSVMVDGPAWASGAQALQSVSTNTLDVGLHLDFTELAVAERIVPVRPLRQMWQASYGRRFVPAQLAQEIHRQLDKFEQHAQRMPAYVDGHQHIHQLPQVREALLQVLEQRYGQAPTKPWLRNTRAGAGLAAGWGNAAKAQVIAALGQGAFMRQAQALGYASNRSLLGVYGFTGDAAAFQRLLQAWLQRAQDGDLLMCHPALGQVEGDAIAAARVQEYQVLASDWLGALLPTLPLQLQPVSRSLAN